MTVALATPTGARLHLRARVGDLADAVTYASLAVPRRAPMPILDAVSITGHAAAAEVTGFDYDQAATARLDAAGIGQAAVDRHRLRDLLRGLDPGAEVRLDAEETRLSVRCGNLHATLPLVDGEFPSIPTTGATPVATLDERTLAALRRVAISAGADDTLPHLTAIQFSVDDGELVAASTDRYRLTVYRTGLRAVLPEPMLVPAKALDDALKFTTARKRATRGVPATLGRIEQDGICWAALSSVGYTRSLRTVDGEFPAWRTLLPTEFSARARVNARSLRDAITQLKPAIDAGGTSRHTGRRQPTRPMILDLAAGDCRASAGGGTDCQVSVPLDVAYDGDPMQVAFIPTYLADSADVLGGDELDINLVTPVKPALLTSPTDTAMSYLLMPVRMAA